MISYSPKAKFPFFVQLAFLYVFKEMEKGGRRKERKKKIRKEGKGAGQICSTMPGIFSLFRKSLQIHDLDDRVILWGKESFLNELPNQCLRIKKLFS